MAVLFALGNRRSSLFLRLYDMFVLSTKTSSMKGPKLKKGLNIYQIIKNSLRRTIKNLIVNGERYPLHIYYHGIENLQYLFEK